MKKRLVSMLLLTAMLSMTGCAGAGTPIDEVSDSQAVVREASEININTNMHMASIMDQLSDATPEDNILLSGTSINMALGMTMQGADGDSLSALEDFYGADAGDVADYANSLMTRYDKIKGVDVKMSNAIYCDENNVFTDEYVKKLKDKYRADSSALPFHSSPESSADAINDFCNDSTDGMIPEIVSSDIVNQSDAILVNAIYFNGKWAKKFEDHQVNDFEFNNISGQVTTVKGMSAKTTDTYVNDNAMAFSYAYKDDSIVFIGVLPDESICDDNGNFNISDINIDDLLQSHIKQNAYFTVPKFSLECNSILDDALKNEGLGSLYENYDLTSMAEAPLSVSTVIHKVKVEIDEEGTKAAAATAVATTKNAVEVESFIEIRLDRPFAFMVYDKEADEVLFMGKVVTL